MGLLNLGVLALACLATVQSLPFPQGRKFEYEYCAEAYTGIVEPVSSTTGLKYCGILTVEAFSDKTVLMQLSNVESTFYNSDKKNMKGMKEPLPKEAKFIEKPFLVDYTGSKIDNILVMPDEPLWAVNIKKGIAGVFQLDMDKWGVGAGYTEESNIYGQCKNIEYNVRKIKKDVFEVTKMISFEKCANSFQRFGTVDSFQCEPDVLSMGSAKRMYTLDMGDHPVITNVTTTSERLVHAFNGEEGAYKTYSEQKFTFTKESEIPADHIVTNKYTVKKSLIYEHLEDLDLTFGRNTLSQEKLIAVIEDMIEKAAKRFDRKLTLDISQLHYNPLELATWLMVSLTEESFEMLYAKITTRANCLEDSKWNIFLDLLPQVGTHSSVMFMKKLLVAQKVGENHSFKMMSQYPFYVKVLSEKLLVEMEELLHLKQDDYRPNYYQDFTNTAILSFSNLLYKTYLHGQCSRKVFEKYVTKFFKNFEEKKEYADKVIYIQALRNMQLGTVFEQMLPIVENRNNSYHIRVHAIAALYANAMKHPAEMYQLFWPIFTDRTEHLEIRTFAMKMLLVAEPTPARFFSIYWYMQGEPSQKLYKMYYSTLTALTTSVSPCMKGLSKLAKRFWRYVDTPAENSATKYAETRLIEFISSIGIGNFLQITVVPDESSSWPAFMYYTRAKTQYGMMLEKVGLYVKMAGVSDVVNFNKKRLDREPVHTYESIVEMIENEKVKINSPEPLLGEFFYEWQNKIVISYNLRLADKANNNNIIDEFTTPNEKCEHLLNMQFSLSSTLMYIFHTTDFGTFAYAGYMQNSLSSIKGNFTKPSDTEKGGVSMHYGNVNYHLNRAELYNPINDLYQGVTKYFTTESGVAGNMTMGERASPATPLSVLWTDSHGNNGFTMHKHTITFVASLDDMLHGTQSSTFSVASAYDHNKMTKTTWETIKEAVNLQHVASFKIENLGIEVTMMMYKCDALWERIVERMREVSTNFADLYVNGEFSEEWKEIIYQVITQFTEQGLYHNTEGSCGIAMRVEPLFKDDTSVMILKYDSVTSNEPTTIKTKYTPFENESSLSGSIFTYKNPDKIYYWWNLTTEFVQDFGLAKVSNWKFTSKNWQKEKLDGMCMEYKYDYDAGSCAHPEAAFHDLDPLKSSTMKLKLSWGHPKAIGMCPECHSIDIITKGSVSDEQIEASTKADKWPFKQCKEELKGKPFNYAIVACDQAAVELSTYRKYDNYVTFKSAPTVVEATIEILNEYKNLSIIPIATPLFDEKGNAKVKYTIILPMNPEENHNIEFIEGNTTKKVRFSIYSVIGPLNPKVKRVDDFYIENKGTCVISSTTMRSYGNVTFTDFEKGEQYLALAECVPMPGYAIFMKQTEKLGPKFQIVTTNRTIGIVPAEGGEFTLSENGETLDLAKHSEKDTHFWVTKHSSGYHFQFPQLKLDMTVRPEFTVITSPEGNSCGLCNTRNYEYEDYVSHVDI